MATDIVAFFTSGGTAVTGLSPNLDAWRTDGTQDITSQTMTEIAGGYYKYSFTAYTPAIDYCFRADGGATLPASERYMFSTNEVDQVSVGGGGAPRVSVVGTGKKSPWTHRQKDKIIKDTRDTKELLKNVSKNMDKYHKDELGSINNLSKTITLRIDVLVDTISNIRNRLSKKSGISKEINKIIKSLGEYKNIIKTVSSVDDINKIINKVDDLDKSVTRMLIKDLSEEELDEIRKGFKDGK